jgi:hypothetical protein
MVTRAIAVLQEDGFYAFAFESVGDANALIAKADTSHYGYKYEVFAGSVIEFFDAYNIENGEELGYDDDSVKAITHEIAQKYLTAGKTIWDIAQNAEEGTDGVTGAWMQIEV